jgi:hypothetical protein
LLKKKAKGKLTAADEAKLRALGRQKEEKLSDLQDAERMKRLEL